MGLFPGWVRIPLSRYRDWVAGVFSLCSSRAAFRLDVMRSLTTFCYSTRRLQRELYSRSNSISYSLVILVPHPISMEQDPSDSVSLLFDFDWISYSCLFFVPYSAVSCFSCWSCTTHSSWSSFWYCRSCFSSSLLAGAWSSSTRWATPITGSAVQFPHYFC
jgi:hypothetical protein